MVENENNISEDILPQPIQEDETSFSRQQLPTISLSE